MKKNAIFFSLVLLVSIVSISFTPPFSKSDGSKIITFVNNAGFPISGIYTSKPSKNHWELLYMDTLGNMEVGDKIDIEVECGVRDVKLVLELADYSSSECVIPSVKLCAKRVWKIPRKCN